MQQVTRRRRLATAVVLAGLTLSACSSGGGSGGSGGNAGSSDTAQSTAEAVSGGTLNMLGAGDVDYMDPNISYYSIGYLALRPWSRQLFTYPATPDHTTDAVPDLATELPTTDNGGVSEDGLTYTITLRPDAKWNTSPARAVTAQDVVRGIKRTCNPAQPFGGLPDYEGLIKGFQSFCDGYADAGTSAKAIADYANSHDIEGIQAKDDHTVVFTLTHPAAYFVDMLTMPAFSPAPEEYDQYVPGSAELAQHTISDGPYQVESYSPTKKIVFTRNPAWEASSDPVRKAYVDKIVIDETVTQDSTQQQLQTGTPSADMEFDNFPPPSQLPGLISKKDPNLTIGPTASSNPYLVFNTASPNNDGALGKAEVRQALSYAIVRASLVQVLGGKAVNAPLSRVLPTSIVGGEKPFDLYPFDVDKAKSMLKDAGADGMTIKILYRNKSEGSTKVFQTVQQELSQAGVKVEGVASPNADFYTKYLQVPSVAKRGVWDMAIAGWGADWYGNAALSYFNPLFSGKPSFPPVGSNFGLYDSAKTNDLIKQAESAKTEDEAAQLWAAADKQVMTDAAFYPITNPQQANYHASQVHDTVYVPAIQNYDPTNVWLSPDKNGG